MYAHVCSCVLSWGRNFLTRKEKTLHLPEVVFDPRLHPCISANSPPGPPHSATVVPTAAGALGAELWAAWHRLCCRNTTRTT